MSNDRSYSEAEIAQLLKRSAELQAEDESIQTSPLLEFQEPESAESEAPFNSIKARS